MGPIVAAAGCDGLASIQRGQLGEGGDDVGGPAGPGVAETGKLGTGWRVLPEAAGRFYADPFAVHREGQAFVFVEDFDYAAGKAAISVVPFNADGTPQAARIVLCSTPGPGLPELAARHGARVLSRPPAASKLRSLLAQRPVQALRGAA